MNTPIEFKSQSNLDHLLKHWASVSSYHETPKQCVHDMAGGTRTENLRSRAQMPRSLG